MVETSIKINSALLLKSGVWHIVVETLQGFLGFIKKLLEVVDQ